MRPSFSAHIIAVEERGEASASQVILLRDDIPTQRGLLRTLQQSRETRRTVGHADLRGHGVPLLLLFGKQQELSAPLNVINGVADPPGKQTIVRTACEAAPLHLTGM